MDDWPEILTSVEAAKYLNCTVNFVRRRLRYEVRFIQRRPRGPMRFRRSDLEDWLDRHSHGPMR